MWSWDHLSSKALIRVVPDKLIVWNETQRDEALRFHGIPADRVIVTGAQCFDQLVRSPADAGPGRVLRPGRPARRTAPFVLYVGSALFKGSPSEALFAARWAEAVRRSADPRLRDVPILVRPHPQRLDEWRAPEAVAALARAGVTVWGSNPVDPESRADYFDSLYHAAAVVGLNTSALVEAAIVDRPVFTLLLPEFRENQEGTFHFHHLMTVGDGFLNAGPVARRARRAAGRGARRARRCAPIVRSSSASSGRAASDVAATPVFVEALEAGGRARAAAAAAGAAVDAGAASAGVRSGAGRPRAHRRTHLLEPGEAARACRQRRGHRRTRRRSAARSVSTSWRASRARRASRLVVRTKTAIKQALGATGARADHDAAI